MEDRHRIPIATRQDTRAGLLQVVFEVKKQRPWLARQIKKPEKMRKK
jgi:hypothetical protein